MSAISFIFLENVQELATHPDDVEQFPITERYPAKPKNSNSTFGAGCGRQLPFVRLFDFGVR